MFQRQTYQTSERRGHHIVTILGEEKAENVTAGKIYGKRYRKRQQKNMLCRISALHTQKLHHCTPNISAYGLL